MTDYYKLLNVEPSASADEIQAAIKKVRRVWNTRSTNPNADIRAEAEQCIRDIAQAEKILLDAGERAKYDVALSQSSNSAPTSTTSSSQQQYGDNSWLDQASYFRNRGDYISLAQLAQNVVNVQPQNALAWYILGDAHYYQGNAVEAERCCLQSIRLEPSDMPYETLGFIYMDHDKYADAYHCFSKAVELDPNTPGYKFLCAEALRLMERTEEALSTAEAAYKQNPDNLSTTAKSIYFCCLRDRIYQATSYNRNSGRHLITNERQLQFVKQYLPKLSTMVDKDRHDQVKVEEELRQMVIAAEKTSGFFAKPGYVKNYETSSDEVRRSGLQ